MNHPSEDPRLTAYALGELEGDERAELEALLAEDAGLRAELEALRETARIVETELARAPKLALSASQREAIEGALSPAPKPKSKAKLKTGTAPETPKRRLRWGWALAAGLPLFLAAGALTLGGTRKGVGGEDRVAWTTRSEDDETNVNYAAPPPLASASSPSAMLGATSDLPGKVKGEAKQDQSFNTESYDKYEDNPFIRVAVDPRSTFSIDVDTASYSMVRRFLLQDSALPPKGAVRIEELLNYFSYDYPEARPGEVFTVSAEVNEAPWAKGHRLVRIGIKAKEVPVANRPASNLVFLLDTSGSMDAENKLPLLKRAFKLLIQQLDGRDRVSIVTYAGSSGLVLPPTSADRKGEILAALDRLQAGGSTNGGQGIQLAYATAAEHLRKGGTNRVILATDGDFNVGVTSQSDLIDLVESKAKSGVFLSVLGFGMGNYKDSTLEKLADKGNGNYAYIDDFAEAKKVFGEQVSGTLVTVAKDVKLQIELNPNQVEAFRLIGYENRVLQHQDFNDDRKDAGDIGAGHTVTALYELVSAGDKVPGPGVDDLKYQKLGPLKPEANSGELMTIKLRYKMPDGQTSRLLELPVRDEKTTLGSASRDFRFAAAVASFGMLLRDSPFKGSASYAEAIKLAESGAGDTRDSAARREFVGLVKKAESLASR
jgi:Ca-activated chloride channel homolog